MAKRMEREFFIIQQERNMKGILKMENMKERESTTYQMESSFWEITKMEKKMV